MQVSHTIRARNNDAERKKQEVYRFFCEYYAKYGLPPTIREIMDNTRLNSTSHVHWVLRELAGRGLLKRAEDDSPKYLPTTATVSVSTQMGEFGEQGVGDDLWETLWDALIAYYPETHPMRKHWAVRRGRGGADELIHLAQEVARRANNSLVDGKL